MSATYLHSSGPDSAAARRPRASGRGLRGAEQAGDPLLAGLAQRVRGARGRLALTRRALAEQSGVSERHLAQLESGTGNISVLLLARVARVLDISVADLLRDVADREREIDVINELLGQLSPGALTQLRQSLVKDYGPALARRRHRIALTGLRGAGKSTLGAALAKRLQVPFVELDREVEREAGISLNEIFLLYGQGGFRRYERQCLERVLRQHERCVIATGGSIVTEPGTYEHLLSACFTVWVQASPEEHMARVVAQGDLRPMQGNDQSMADLRRLLHGREALYGRADAVVDTSGRDAESSLRELHALVRG